MNLINAENVDVMLEYVTERAAALETGFGMSSWDHDAAEVLFTLLELIKYLKAEVSAQKTS